VRYINGYVCEAWQREQCELLGGSVLHLHASRGEVQYVPPKARRQRGQSGQPLCLLSRLKHNVKLDCRYPCFLASDRDLLAPQASAVCLLGRDRVLLAPHGSASQLAWATMNCPLEGLVVLGVVWAAGASSVLPATTTFWTTQVVSVAVEIELRSIKSNQSQSQCCCPEQMVMVGKLRGQQPALKSSKKSSIKTTLTKKSTTR
jgi:hypothetical protein